MPASAILSVPAPMASTVSPPLSEAGAALPTASAGFGALVDAKTAPASQPVPPPSLLDPSVTLTRPAGAVQPADPPPGVLAEAGGMPAPVTDPAGHTLTLPPVLEAEAQPAAPVAAKPAVPSAHPVADAEDAPSEPAEPSPGGGEPSAQLSPAPANVPITGRVPLPETAPPPEKAPADEAEAKPDGDKGAPPVAGTPQAPIPAPGPVPPAAQPVATTSAQAGPDTPEPIAEPRRTKAEKQTPVAANGAVSVGKEAPAGDAARPAAQSIAAAPADAPATADQPDGGLPSPLLTQTMAPVASRPTAVYPHGAQGSPQSPVVAAQPGRMGADIGVEIAKAAKGDREDLLIRLDPRDMGRINVRLSFDGDGVLRAVMSADSPGALEMLRRESGDLNRALADAGIRSDAQSLRFDARPGDQGQGGSQSGQRGQQSQPGGPHGQASDGAAELADVHYRPLRSSGQVDLMA